MNSTTWLALSIAAGIGTLIPAALRAGTWTPITESLQNQATANEVKPIWPGGCSGEVVIPAKRGPKLPS